MRRSGCYDWIFFMCLFLLYFSFIVLELHYPLPVFKGRDGQGNNAMNMTVLKSHV
jgi:hypothetical protein